MRFKKTILLVMACLLLMTTPLIVAQETEETVTQEDQSEIAAIVNGEEITMSEVDQFANTQQLVMSLYRSNQEFAQLLLQTEAGNELIKEFQRRKLDQLITQKLLEQEAEARNIEVSQEEQDEQFNQFLEQVKQQNDMTEEELTQALQQQGIESLEQYKEMYLEQTAGSTKVNKLRDNIMNEVEVEESAVKDYYENNPQEFESEEQVEASHILVDTEEEAASLLEELEEGADFAELAKENSTGPSSEDGGSLGYITKEDQIAEGFKEAAFAMDVGEVSDPVETQYGFHIIKVTDRKEAGKEPYEEAKKGIKDSLLQEKQQQKWNEFVEGLREEAEIEKKL